MYNNEQEVGEAVRDKIAEGVVARSDIFVVSKVQLKCALLAANTHL